MSSSLRKRRLLSTTSAMGPPADPRPSAWPYERYPRSCASDHAPMPHWHRARKPPWPKLNRPSTAFSLPSIGGISSPTQSGLSDDEQPLAIFPRAFDKLEAEAYCPQSPSRGSQYLHHAVVKTLEELLQWTAPTASARSPKSTITASYWSAALSAITGVGPRRLPRLNSANTPRVAACVGDHFPIRVRFCRGVQ